MTGARRSPKLARLIKQAVGLVWPIYYLLPETRGIWSMSAIDESQGSRDSSGHNRHLTGSGTPTFGVDNYLPYAEYNGSSQYHTAADAGALDITGNLSIGGWFYFNNAAGSDESMFGKWTTTANQRSYGLRRDTDGTIEARVSVNGTAEIVQASTDTPAASTWFFCAMRYIPSSELSVFIGLHATPGAALAEDLNVTSIPASLNNGSSQLSVAVREVGGVKAAYADMRASMLFLCAASISDDHLNMLYAQTKPLAKL